MPGRRRLQWNLLIDSTCTEYYAVWSAYCCYCLSLTCPLLAESQVDGTDLTVEEIWETPFTLPSSTFRNDLGLPSNATYSTFSPREQTAGLDSTHTINVQRSNRREGNPRPSNGIWLSLSLQASQRSTNKLDEWNLAICLVPKVLAAQWLPKLGLGIMVLLDSRSLTPVESIE